MSTFQQHSAATGTAATNGCMRLCSPTRTQFASGLSAEVIPSHISYCSMQTTASVTLCCCALECCNEAASCDKLCLPVSATVILTNSPSATGHVNAMPQCLACCSCNPETDLPLYGDNPLSPCIPGPVSCPDRQGVQ